jgi:arylformamidase
MALIDISRSISPATAVWPGDREIAWTWTTRLGRDDASVNLGSIELSTHVGSHVDAPFHVDEEGGTVDDLSLSAFVGRADVVDVGSASAIRPKHLEGVTADRVLFKTEASHLSDDQWPDSITPFEPTTIRQLENEGATLVGTDAPSVDPLDSKTLPAHHALVEAGIVNLEGLCFEGVAPGSYFLIALPLKLTNADASPVRAVLREANMA